MLQDKLYNLALKKKAPNYKLIINFNNEDNFFSQPQSSWQSTFIARNYFTPISKSPTSFSILKTTIEFEKNKKYPNISLFYDNADIREK